MTMNSNPHFEAAVRGEVLMGETLAAEGQTDATIIAEAQLIHASATLALAYEQRTANLMSMYKLMRDEGNTDVPEYDELARNMAIRLGMLPTT